MHREPNYTVLSSYPPGLPSDALVLRDEGPWDKYPTITNKADEVVAGLVRHGVLRDGQRLFYFDSCAGLDEILVIGGRFAGFKAGGGLDRTAWEQFQ